jgi:hypothetical protein
LPVRDVHTKLRVIDGQELGDLGQERTVAQTFGLDTRAV